MSFLMSFLTIAAPLLLAATGALYTELSGMLNIGIEGLMLAGAFSSVLFVTVTGNLVLGLILSVIATVVLSAVSAGITLRLKANVFITGMALNLLVSAMTSLISSSVFKTKGVVRVGIPQSGQFTFIAIAAVGVIIAYLLIYRTVFGYRLRATALNPELMHSLGLGKKRYCFAAFIVSGAYAGLAGAAVALPLSAWVPSVTSGRGWIALMLVYLGARNLFGITAATLVYSLIEVLVLRLQGTITIPSELILAEPYILTLVMFLAVSISFKGTARKKRRSR